jgi:peptide deformylase
MKILLTPHPFLRHTAKPVISWDKKLAQQITDMTQLLISARDPEGVGLAATQVGLDQRLFLINSGKSINVYINPQIISQSSKTLLDKYKSPKKRFLEGCLSIPKIWGFVNRPYSITLEYQLPQGLTKTQQKFTDKQTATILHELDHLNGILFTDRILEQRGTIFRETPSGLKAIQPSTC